MFQKTKLGRVQIITKRDLNVSLATVISIGVLICLVFYYSLSYFAAKALASNDSVGNVTVDNLNSLTATYGPSIVAILGAIVPLLFALALVMRFKRSEVVTQTKLKDFNLYLNSEKNEYQAEKFVFFRILADYCKKLKVVEHPNDDLHLMDQLNADKYRNAKSRFLELIKNDSEIANISTLDFANLSLTDEKKVKIDRALADGVNG